MRCVSLVTGWRVGPADKFPLHQPITTQHVNSHQPILRRLLNNLHTIDSSKEVSKTLGNHWELVLRAFTHERESSKLLKHFLHGLEMARDRWNPIKNFPLLPGGSWLCKSHGKFFVQSFLQIQKSENLGEHPPTNYHVNRTKLGLNLVKCSRHKNILSVCIDSPIWKYLIIPTIITFSSQCSLPCFFKRWIL